MFLFIDLKTNDKEDCVFLNLLIIIHKIKKIPSGKCEGQHTQNSDCHTCGCTGSPAWWRASQRLHHSDPSRFPLWASRVLASLEVSACCAGFSDYFVYFPIKTLIQLSI